MVDLTDSSVALVLEKSFSGNRIFFLFGGNKKRSQGKKSNDLKFVVQ
jgi:hypothetical protein